MTALGCCLQHWADDTSLGPQLLLLHGPFPPCTRCISSIQPPGLLFCPSLMTTPPFLILLFIFFLFNLLITGLSRPKAPSPLYEEQKAKQPWHLSQLVPIPLHDPSKTGLCCHTALAQKGHRYLPSASYR